MKCIILQVLKGLQYLHENYIIHRWEWQDGAGGTEGCLGTPPASWERRQGRETMERWDWIFSVVSQLQLLFPTGT